MSEKTILYLLRHGEAEGNLTRFFHGQYDSDLTETGEKQAKLAAQRLLSEPIDVVYASDLKRAYKTAKAYADLAGKTIHTDPGLREIDGGDWENVRWADLPVRYPDSYPAWENAMHLVQIPNGESMEALQLRIIATVEKIVDKNRGKRILLVFHGTAIKAFLCYCHGYPLDRIMDVEWHDNTAISKLEVDESCHYNILLEGDSSHLGDLSTIKKQKWWMELQKKKEQEKGDTTC